MMTMGSTACPTRSPIPTRGCMSSPMTPATGSVHRTSGSSIASTKGMAMESLKLPLLTSNISASHHSSTSSHHGHHGSSNNDVNYKNSLLKIPLQAISSIRHNPDALSIGIALAAWYLVGVLAICTTKLLASTPLDEGGVPSPLVLTLQQMTLGSLFLRTFLVIKGKFKGQTGIQPWPVEVPDSPSKGWLKLSLDYLLLAGLFNGLDFLASNTSFSHSSASFVETIKASEPITTTALAIWWGLDRLGKWETFSLTILISGVLLSTYANAMATQSTASPDTTTTSLQESIKTCLTVMTANLCFAFRAMAQKMLRGTPSGNSQQLDDFNLLFRMQQTGAASLFVPVMLFQHYTLTGVLLGRPNHTIFFKYVGLSLVNAWAFATYSLASCFILSRISVVQHSGFGCLRRLFAIVVTSVAFGVPISTLGCLGILMSVVGFSGFTHFRFQRQGQGKKGSLLTRKGSNMTDTSTDDVTLPSSSSGGSIHASSSEEA